jgi:biopolymer transport protein TolR
MNRRFRQRRLVADINITPFTDVILVLLIIFMIATPLISQCKIKVNLPKSKGNPTAESAGPEEADITITREGIVYLNEQMVTKNELRERVERLYRNNPDLNVIVRSDKFVRLQELVDILDPLTELGITKINLGTTKER